MGSTAQSASSSSGSKLRYADVGINLTDPVFHGSYHGKKHHEDDLADVIQRSLDSGCLKHMVTASDLVEAQKAIKIAAEYPGTCYATIGVHPCSAQSFDLPANASPTAYLSALEDLARTGIASGTIVAFGEIGLDYDRLFLCPQDTQLKYFALQLELAVKLQLPLFLHSRAAHPDFVALLNSHLDDLPKRGLVHSFTGTLPEMQELVALGFDIGVNGCSLKTEENVAVVREIPLEHIQVETDGPWCEMRASHASAAYLEGAPELPRSTRKERWVKGQMVKGRNEPCAVGRVVHAVARIKGVGVEEVAEAAWRNSIKMFGLGEETVDVITARRRLAFGLDTGE